MLRSVLLVTLAAAVFGSSAAASTATREAIVFRIVDTPVFLEPTAECPYGRGEAQLRSLRGAIVGRVENCVLASEFSCEGRCTLTERARQTFHLRDGTIDVSARLIYRFSDDFSFALHTISGSIVGGTGRYAGASGWLVGGGLIRFDPDFTPHPELTEILVLT
jgi:hypothetical protein